MTTQQSDAEYFEDRARDADRKATAAGDESLNSALPYPRREQAARLAHAHRNAAAANLELARRARS